jgi:hypothetical protein
VSCNQGSNSSLILDDKYLNIICYPWNVSPDILLQWFVLYSLTLVSVFTFEGQAIRGERQKPLHCPQLDHHDADGLAGHKTWRTAQNTTRIFNILTFLYMRPLFYGEFADFTILYLQFHIYTFYIYIQLITCIRNTKSKYRCTTCNISASNCVRATDPL